MEIKDKDNNIITIKENGNVTIYLDKDKKIRNIGTFINGIYKKYDEEKHIFRILNDWSIPFDIYKMSDIIQINTNLKTYTIETSTIKPEILHFRGSGIEKKVYIPLKYWKT